MNNKTFIILQKIQNDLYDYLNMVNSLICNRCCTCHYQELQKVEGTKDYTTYLFNLLNKNINQNDKKYDQLFHWLYNDGEFRSNQTGPTHHVFLKDYLYSNKITKENIENWFYDTEHGYFHGLMAGFISYFLMKYVTDYNYKKYVPDYIKKKNDGKTKTAEYDYKIQKLGKIIFSSLLHDFVRCSNGEKDHDKNMKNYFPNLLDETYRHSKPLECDKDNILITSDRIELRRYDDYNSWKDDKIHNYYENKFSKEDKLYLKLFYENIRPCLEYFYKNRKKHFIRHGLECNFDLLKTNIYPQKHYTHLAEYVKNKEKFTDNNFAIEIDRFPFKNCSTHSGNAIWTYFKGFLVIDENLLKESKIGYWVNTNLETNYAMHFDHLCLSLNNEKTIDKWNFLLRPEIFLCDLPEFSTKYFDMNIISHQAESGKKITKDNIYNSLDFLIENKAHFVVDEVLNLLDINIFNVSKYYNLSSVLNSFLN